jgi:hypothetical protein
MQKKPLLKKINQFDVNVNETNNSFSIFGVGLKNWTVAGSNPHVVYWMKWERKSLNCPNGTESQIFLEIVYTKTFI